MMRCADFSNTLKTCRRTGLARRAPSVGSLGLEHLRHLPDSIQQARLPHRRPTAFRISLPCPCAAVTAIGSRPGSTPEGAQDRPGDRPWRRPAGGSLRSAAAGRRFRPTLADAERRSPGPDGVRADAEPVFGRRCDAIYDAIELTRLDQMLDVRRSCDPLADR